jgi:hypothetical protein
MIKGRKRIELTSDNILKLVTDYDIFMQFMPHKNWKLNDVCISPFPRNGTTESNPSFLIGNKNGYISYVDFGLSLSGDCFSFVKELHNIPTFHETLAFIDKEMGLGISGDSNVGKYKEIVSTYKQPEENKEKHSVIIQVVTRKFTKSELDYWKSYYQTLDDLRDNHVYSINKLFLNRKRFPLKETELRFGYLYGDKWKIYRPNNDKKTKWVPNNVPNTVMDGKENILNCDVAFIGKSKKDMMVIKKVFPCSCAVQNEGQSCFSIENVEFLKANSNRQILSFDSDAPGVTNSQQITKLFDFDYCNVPRKYLTEGIKDWSDLAKNYSLKVIEDYLKERKII